jgi:uncharacterized protein (TIGR03437 family)
VISFTFHELIRTSVSRDGSVVAITATDDCINFTFCALSNTRLRATIHQPGTGPRTEPEGAILSPNGQYAFLSQSGLFAKARILNLATGASTPPFDRRLAGNRNVTRQIANNGTAIQTDGLRLWPSGELRPLPVEGCVAINAAATRAYCEDFPRLNLLDIATGRLTPIFTAQQGTVLLSFDISESGDHVAFLDAAGLWLIRSDGTALRRLADADTGVSEFVLSADGNVVFASTTDSRLLRIDIGAGSTVELVPSTPAIRLPDSGELVKGSAYEYRSESIPEILQVRLPGIVAPAFHSGPEVVAFHVPFDAPTANGWPELVRASQPSGPFISSVLPGPVNIVDFGPFWYTQGGPPGSFSFAIAALHQDFRGPVSMADPSVPGEIVHVYGGGFGPVALTPSSGQPAPESPLSRATQQPLECTLASGAPLEIGCADILYAGLAPGWIGLYQLDVRLPDIPAPLIPDRFPALRCGIPNSTAAAGYLPYQAR